MTVKVTDEFILSDNVLKKFDCSIEGSALVSF